MDDTEVINFLLSTEIIPLCLRTMEMGSELSKTVATFIVQKILLDNVGLNYICATAERFFAVGAVLGNMVRLQPLCISQGSRTQPAAIARQKCSDPKSLPRHSSMHSAAAVRGCDTEATGARFMSPGLRAFVRCVPLVQVGLLAEQPSVRLLKHIVRCYLRLSDNPRAREALRQCLPDLLRSPQFTACLKEDQTTRK